VSMSAVNTVTGGKRPAGSAERDILSGVQLAWRSD
jgi:hypothetical protein